MMNKKGDINIVIYTIFSISLFITAIFFFTTSSKEDKKTINSAFLVGEALTKEKNLQEVLMQITQQAYISAYYNVLNNQKIDKESLITKKYEFEREFEREFLFNSAYLPETIEDNLHLLKKAILEKKYEIIITKNKVKILVSGVYLYSKYLINKDGVYYSFQDEVFYKDKKKETEEIKIVQRPIIKFEFKTEEIGLYSIEDIKEKIDKCEGKIRCIREEMPLYNIEIKDRGSFDIRTKQKYLFDKEFKEISFEMRV